ncbi:MAG: family 10 glycosylhydrolase [Ignavibacteria bacterium]|nr:family 10 glycosylhydrolase [Ignavibacteria bacterium]
MKKLLVLIHFILIVNALSQTKEELRAVWLTSVDSYVLYSDKNIADAMDYLASIGINVVFPVVWNKGYTLYPSDVMQNTFGVPIWQTFAGRDPLNRVVVEAHRNGIEVIPWFEYGFSPHYASNKNDSGFILKAKPSWALLNKNGILATRNGEFPQFIWMSGINPEVQDFMISLFTEVIDKYDVDGVQGDDRLPAMPVDGGYDSATVAIYKSENNGNNPPQDNFNQTWMRWRANKLNQFYKRLRDSVKTRSSNLIFSSAPSVYPWSYDNYLQDSKTWIDSSTIDNFIPQLYRYDLSSYQSLLNSSLNYVPVNKRDIFFAGVLAKSGNWIIEPSMLLNILNYNRTKNVKGESFFFYEALRSNNNKNGDTLKATFYNQPALLPYRNGNIWRPKATILNEDEAGTFTTGSWRVIPYPAFKQNSLIALDTGYSKIEYFINVPFSAWFSIYAYIYSNTIHTSRAPYKIFTDVDSTEVLVDQSSSKNLGWYKLGDFFLTKGLKKVVRLDNKNIGSGKYVCADAIMLLINRKLSPDVVITSVDETKISKSLPKDFSLSQNFPNPFNSSTIIPFELPKDGYVELRIYDALGRVVFSFDKKFFKAGQHQFNFNANNINSNFPSGVYFYSLHSSEKVITKKMIYLK